MTDKTLIYSTNSYFFGYIRSSSNPLRTLRLIEHERFLLGIPGAGVFSIFNLRHFTCTYYGESVE